MKYVKSFNNNAALVVDDNQHEWVVLGNGIGFGKNAGDPVDETKIIRKFTSSNDEPERMDNLSSFSPEITDATLKVVAATEKTLDVTFSDYQYLTLADHINFAYARAQDGISLSDSATKWEIANLFPAEFKAAQSAIMILNIELGVILPEDEAVFITYHFVNVKNERGSLQDTIEISKLMGDVVNIVQLNYQMTLDTQSFNYSRFISHLRYFFIKMMKHKQSTDELLDPALLTLMATKYPKEYATVEIIGKYLKRVHQWELSPNDEVYLTLHVWRVTHREAN